MFDGMSTKPRQGAGFVVGNVVLGQVFFSSTSVFPRQFNSTGAPLPGKTKNTIVPSPSTQGLHNKP
jgi:hypothetical protein